MTRDHENKPLDGRGLREKVLGHAPDPLCPTEAQKRLQGERCGCRGSDEYCGCQNVVQPAFMAPGYRIGHENREAVRTFFADHIGCTNVECGKALGLSVTAVGRHIAKLRDEWA